ncbi:1,4-alpha-glucan branching enzyme, partial [Pseudomonas syringae]
WARRRGGDGGGQVRVVAAMCPVPRRDCRRGAPMRGAWAGLWTSGAETYAGANCGNGGEGMTEAEPAHGMDDSLVLNLPPLAVLILKPTKD